MKVISKRELYTYRSTSGSWFTKESKRPTFALHYRVKTNTMVNFITSVLDLHIIHTTLYTMQYAEYKQTVRRLDILRYRKGRILR